MINIVVGAGVLSLPFALRCTGIVAGGVAIVFVCMLSIIAVRLLTKCSDRFCIFSYKEIAVKAIGPKAGKLVEAVVMLYATGLCIAFSVLVGDFLPSVSEHLFPDTILTDRAVAIGLASFFVLFPLSLIRDVDRLKFSSFFAVVFVTFFIGAASFRFKESGITENKVDWVINPSIKLLQSFPIIGVAFVCHFNALQLYETLAKRTAKMMMGVSYLSLFLCALIYLGTALVGYLSFGVETEGNLANNYDADDVLILVARLGMTVTVLFSYPLLFMAVRTSIELLFCKRYSPTAYSSKTRSFFITFFGVAFCSLIAYFAKDVETVLTFVGSVFATCVVYFFPAIFYIRIFPKKGHFVPYCMIFFGVIFGVGGLTSLTMESLGLL
eukprot:TRINITY_DN27713_c0_g1_i1.p1 TRINITY_DN27713_c0_g1~~TRINITY_DN27713_c0_g1_i1.p1  ORF type:complete len:431 (-),score=81.07 TRINITY_DN27713_c0_g1_i1:5-1150(-)